MQDKNEKDVLIDNCLEGIEQILTLLMEMNQLENKKNDGDIKEAEYKQQQAALKLRFEEQDKKLKDLPKAWPMLLQDLKTKNVKSGFSHKTRTQKNMDEAADIGDKMAAFGKIVDVTKALSSFQFLAGGFARFMQGYGAASEKGIGFIGSMIGCFFTMKDLFQNWKIIRKVDRTQSITGMIVNISKLTQTVGVVSNLIGFETGFATAVTGAIAGGILAGADAGITVFKGVSHYRNYTKRKKASDLARSIGKKEEIKRLETGEKTDSRYREALIKLNRMMGKKQKIETGTSIMGAAASVAAAALIGFTALGGFVITMPALAISILASIIQIKMTSKNSREMRRTMDAVFFEADDMIKVAKKDNLAENGQPMSKKQEENLRNVILRRIAANYGYYSPSHLANTVALEFAKYLLKGAKDPGEEGEMCVTMMKGFGLRVTQNKRTREVITPTASDIAKKMCG